VKQAVKDVAASHKALVRLLESIEHFLKRLDIYTKMPPTMAMVEIHVKIMVELLSTLGLVTKRVKQKRSGESPPPLDSYVTETRRSQTRKETFWRK
jgi:hypothetical protein